MPRAVRLLLRKRLGREGGSQNRFKTQESPKDQCFRRGWASPSRNPASRMPSGLQAGWRAEKTSLQCSGHRFLRTFRSLWSQLGLEPKHGQLFPGPGLSGNLGAAPQTEGQKGSSRNPNHKLLWPNLAEEGLSSRSQKCPTQRWQRGAF